MRECTKPKLLHVIADVDQVRLHDLFFPDYVQRPLFGASIIWKNPIFVEHLPELLRLQAPHHIGVCSFD